MDQSSLPEQIQAILNEWSQADLQQLQTALQTRAATDSATQVNLGTAKGFQVSVQGGTAYIGDQIHIDAATLEAVLDQLITKRRSPMPPEFQRANTKTAMTPRERLALSRTITGLTVQEFNELLLLLDPPAGLIPPPSTSQGDRVYALLNWAQSTTGCGLGAVQDALGDILP